MKREQQTSFKSALVLSLCLIAVFFPACGKNSNSLAGYDGYVVESFDNSAKDSNAFPGKVHFDINGTKVEAHDCWLQIKAKTATTDEIVSGQNCSLVRMALSFKVQVHDGTLQKSKSPDGKLDLITVKFNGTTADGAKYRYVFKGQKKKV